MIIYDLTGALFSFIATYFFIRQNTNAWPASLIATTINGWLYWHKGIYADMCLECFYFMMSIYGWVIWSYKPHQSDGIRPRVLSMTKGWGVLSCIGILYLSVFSALSFLTDSNIAHMDALTTSLSIMAQLLMCQKYIATWYLWFIADALYLILYIQKNLPYHTLLMVIYLILAILGYLNWTKSYKTVTLPKNTI